MNLNIETRIKNQGVVFRNSFVAQLNNIGINLIKDVEVNLQCWYIIIIIENFIYDGDTKFFWILPNGATGIRREKCEYPFVWLGFLYKFFLP